MTFDEPSRITYRDDTGNTAVANVMREQKGKLDPDQTMLGGKQKQWLLNGFSSSPARWQVLGNQAPMGQTDLSASRTKTKVYLDPWDGYVAERNEVLGQAQARGVLRAAPPLPGGVLHPNASRDGPTESSGRARASD